MNTKSKRNIYLTGLMGCGKSTVGSEVAQRMSREFIDLDVLITKNSGYSIGEIFFKFGEQRFREWETKTLSQVSIQTKVVVATGGGIVTRKINCDLLTATGIKIYLKAPPELLLERLASDNSRPLLRGLTSKKRLEKLQMSLVQREENYCSNAIIVDACGSVSEVTTRILASIREYLLS